MFGSSWLASQPSFWMNLYIGTVCFESIMKRLPMSYTWIRSGVFFCCTAVLYLVIASSYSPTYVALTWILPWCAALNCLTILFSATALAPCMLCQNSTVVTPLAFFSASGPGALSDPVPDPPPPQPAAPATTASAAAPDTATRRHLGTLMIRVPPSRVTAPRRPSGRARCTSGRTGQAAGSAVPTARRRPPPGPGSRSRRCAAG